MPKNILAALALLCATASFAAVDVNTARAADLDGLKGIGPAMSRRILLERGQGPFRNWADLLARVKGLGQANATRLSTEGLRVNGEAFGEDAAGKAAE